MTTQELELEIESIAAGGDGVARSNGLVIFVPRSAPGDRGRATVEVKGRMGRGVWSAIGQPSSLRVEPPCAHYTADRCGGCQLQHLSYEAQLTAKADMVRDAMQRIGRRTVEAPLVRQSDEQWRYRHKLTLALRRRGNGWLAGLHPFDDPRRVFQLRDCPITDERVVTAWREVLATGAYLPDAPALRASVRLLDEGCALVVEGGRSWRTWPALLERAPSISALWWARDEGDPRLLSDRRAMATPAASFAQVNPAVGRELHAYVVELTLAHRPRLVVDGYAGAGDTAQLLAAAGATVTAIELDLAASRWSGERLAPPSRALQGRVEDRLAESLPAEVVIVNPPRAGVHEQVTTLLESAMPRPRAIVYVSCNPATLARDVSRLPGYRIASLRAFDMFPQTAHVETVCELVPEAA